MSIAVLLAVFAVIIGVAALPHDGFQSEDVALFLRRSNRGVTAITQKFDSFYCNWRIKMYYRELDRVSKFLEGKGGNVFMKAQIETSLERFSDKFIDQRDVLSGSALLNLRSFLEKTGEIAKDSEHPLRRYYEDFLSMMDNCQLDQTS